MTEGFWINFRTGKMAKIEDHEVQIRDPKFYKKLGLSPDTVKEFPKYKIGTDREKFMTWLMTKEPLIRVRGHGVQTTFEFASWGRAAAMDAILDFAENNLGEFSTININNLATGESHSFTFGKFKHLLESKGAEGVMRLGSESTPLMQELDKIATAIDKTKVLKRHL